MKDYQLRAIDERCELYTKITKLRFYINTMVMGDPKTILLTQLNAMGAYLAILDQRIERFIEH